MPRAGQWEFKCEWEANVVARHILVPTSIAAPMCEAPRPDLACVKELANEFDVSLSVAARRWAEMSPAPCAFVEVRGRLLEDGTLALDLTCGWSRGERTRAHRIAWGARADANIVEECVPLKDGTIFVWLRQA
jgi:hypothetical protein